MQDIINQLTDSVPRLLGALAVLVIGFIVAGLIASAVRAAVRRTRLESFLARRMGSSQAAPPDIAGIIGRIVYYVLLLIVLIAVFQILGLTLATQPLTAITGNLLAYLPKLIGAAILFLVAWIAATILRGIVRQALSAARLDQRLGQGEGSPSLANTLTEVVYYIVFLLFLPAILSTLDLTGLLSPVQELLGKVLNFLPNLISAALILVIGIFVARLLRDIVSRLLAAAGLDRLAERIGIAGSLGEQRASGVLGLIVYVLVLLPVITAALDALQLAALTGPVSGMLNRILAAVPNVFAAGITIAIAVVVGRIVSELIERILAGIGFNRLPAQLGIGQEPGPGGRTPAGVVAMLVNAAIVYFAALEALRLLGFTQVATLMTGFIELAGHILLGLIIFALGLWLARLAADAIRGSGTTNANLLARLAQVAILVLSGAIALRQMGVANEIITLAFGLLIGAIAVASAIAFGVGGRDVAQRQLEGWARWAEEGGPSGSPPTPTPPPSSGGPATSRTPDPAAAGRGATTTTTTTPPSPSAAGTTAPTSATREASAPATLGASGSASQVSAATTSRDAGAPLADTGTGTSRGPDETTRPQGADTPTMSSAFPSAAATRASTPPSAMGTPAAPPSAGDREQATRPLMSGPTAAAPPAGATSGWGESATTRASDVAGEARDQARWQSSGTTSGWGEPGRSPEHAADDTAPTQPIDTARLAGRERTTEADMPPGSVRPVGDTCPASYPIKGNHSSGGDYIYHVPGSQNYDRTNAEVCFATEAAAQAAGFRAPRQ